MLVCLYCNVTVHMAINSIEVIFIVIVIVI